MLARRVAAEGMDAATAAYLTGLAARLEAQARELRGWLAAAPDLVEPGRADGAGPA